MKHSLLTHTLLVAIAAGTATSALASSVSVDNCWIRAMPPSVPSVAYFTLKNDGDAAASLSSVSTPAFGMAMLHETITDAGTSKMVHIDSASIPAHGALAFAPKGYHVMLEKPVQTLMVGAKTPMQFRFADGASVQAECEVKPASFTGK